MYGAWVKRNEDAELLLDPATRPSQMITFASTAMKTRAIRYSFVTLLLIGACKDPESDQAANASDSTMPRSATSQVPQHSDEWIVGRKEGVDRNHNPRFLAGADMFQSGLLVIRLDTLRNRAKADALYDWSRADSTVIRGVGSREQIAQTCKVGEALQYGQVAGLMRDTLTEQWSSPRLAWLFDTVSLKIRPVSPDSVLCILEMPD